MADDLGDTSPPHAAERGVPKQGPAALAPVAGIAAVVAGIVSGSILWIGAAVAVAVGTIAIAWPTLRRGFSWEAPELLFQGPLQLGDVFEFTYVQHSKRPLDVPSAKLYLILLCEEEVRWSTGSGDDQSTRRDSRTVAEIPTTAVVEATPEGLVAHGHATIPMDAGGPSFDRSNNKVRWRIECGFDDERLPSATERFGVEVTTALAPELRARPTDTPAHEPPSPSDHNPHIHIDHRTAELAGVLSGHARYVAKDPERFRGITFELAWKTSGRGDVDRSKIGQVRLTAVDGGIDAPWQIPVPPDSPISYQGQLLSIEYELTVQIDIRGRIDPQETTTILVVPAGGRTRYANGPHPIIDTA